MNKQVGALAVVACIGAGAGCTSNVGSSAPSTGIDTVTATTTPTTGSVPDTSFTAAGMHFAIPKRLVNRSDGYAASVITTFGFFSDQRLGVPCTSTPTTRTCGPPVSSLEPGRVLMTVNMLGMPVPEGQPEIEEPNSTIAGQPAQITTERPGDCSFLGATEMVNVEIARPGSGRYQIQFCFTDPVSDQQALVDEMITSITIDN